MSEIIKVKPVLKGNVSRSVHPLGCKQEVWNQIQYVKEQGKYDGAKKVLILGASSGYGLASRISLAFGSGADTIGVSFDRGPKDETNLGSAGWYNNIYFREFAQAAGLMAKNFIGDAFSDEMKEKVIAYIQETFGGKIDLLVYSLAAPKRVDPETGKGYASVLKPIGEAVTGWNINLEQESLIEQTLEPATAEEIEGTIKTMGGEDWQRWVTFLQEADVLAEGFKTILYSYIGPVSTYPIYHHGTIGLAKAATEVTCVKINQQLEDIHGEAVICLSKAVTTKASAVIPTFPLYCTALYKVMQEKGTYETLIMHKDRVFRTMVYGDQPEKDSQGRLRPDYWELDEETQQEVQVIMDQITPENFTSDLTAYSTFYKEFMQLNGFMVDGVTTDEVDFESIVALKP